MQNGKPQLLDFGVADETAWRVGLSCGGKIQIHIAALGGDSRAAILREWKEAIRARAPCAFLTRLADDAFALVYPPQSGRENRFDCAPGAPPDSEMVARAANGGERGRAGKSRRRRRRIFYRAASADAPLGRRRRDSHRASVDSVRARDRLRAAGCRPARGVGDAGALRADAGRLRMAARRARARARRFGVRACRFDARSENRRPRFGERVAAIAALCRRFGRRAIESKARRAADGGGIFTQAEIERIRAPVGIDIGAKTAAEIALSIAAQIVAAFRGKA